MQFDFLEQYVKWALKYVFHYDHYYMLWLRPHPVLPPYFPCSASEELKLCLATLPNT